MSTAERTPPDGRADAPPPAAVDLSPGGEAAPATTEHEQTEAPPALAAPAGEQPAPAESPATLAVERPEPLESPAPEQPVQLESPAADQPVTPADRPESQSSTRAADGPEPGPSSPGEAVGAVSDRRAAPSSAQPGDETAAENAPATGDAAAGAAAANETGGEPPTKKRHRGHRGGRRRSKSRAAEGENGTGSPDAPTTTAGDSQPTSEAAAPTGDRVAGDNAARADAAAVGAAGADAAVADAGSAGGGSSAASSAEGGGDASAATEQNGGETTSRRRRGGRRRSKAKKPAAGEVSSDEASSVEVTGAEETAVEANQQTSAERSSGKRGRGRRTAARRAAAERSPAEQATGDGDSDRGDSAAATASEAEASAAATSAEASSDAAETQSPANSDAAAAAPTKTGRRRRQTIRRPKAIVRVDDADSVGLPAPTPAATPAATTPASERPAVVAEKPHDKVLLVSDDPRELRVALLEDERLAEIYIERPEKKSYLGNVYKGKVESVLNGIDAAFVDFGLEKNGFLYVDDVVNDDGERRARRIADALKPGQEVLVQVAKDPMGSKGARLTTKISLAGRYVVYVPNSSGAGVSRRLRQGERDRLRDLTKELKPKKAALIVRTLAEGHPLEDLKRDLQYLARLWTRIKKKAEKSPAPSLIHEEADISLAAARDLFNDSVSRLIIDSPKREKSMRRYLEKVAPELAPRIDVYAEDEPLFSAYNVEDQIARALERRVPLPSGGNLVIDHAEALTVVDVNSGRFTRGKGLEDTITKTNLEAAREVVRQLRLRDIGGIIIIDFIDMAHARNREAVLETLEAELETDRTKTYVVELSPLGLVEMTRQNTTDGARGILTRSCPHCQGKARVLSEETMALNVERRLRQLARRSTAKAWLIEVNAGVAERISGERLKRLEKDVAKRVFFEGGSRLPIDAFRILAEGSTPQVTAQRIPVREGQEVDVELEYSLSYSPRDAVGYIDGYMLVVEGGRQFLGETRKVRVTATARTGGQATVLRET